MEERLALLRDGAEGEKLGTLSCARQGMYVRFQAVCPRPETQAGLQKVWLEQGTRRLLLGTLAPEGRLLTLRRSVSLAALSAQGVPAPERGIVTGAELLPAARAGSPSQQAEGDAGCWQALPALPVPLPEAEAAGRRGQWRREGEAYLLRFPWGWGQAFPLPSLFCFARVREGAVYYLLDGQGYPLPPP